MSNLNKSIMQKKLTKKQKAVDKLFNPDDSGRSEWISREAITNVKDLDWGKNGVGRHGIYFGDTRFIWEKQGL